MFHIKWTYYLRSITITITSTLRLYITITNTVIPQVFNYLLLLLKHVIFTVTIITPCLYAKKSRSFTDRSISIVVVWTSCWWCFRNCLMLMFVGVPNCQTNGGLVFNYCDNFYIVTDIKFPILPTSIWDLSNLDKRWREHSIVLDNLWVS